MKLFSKFISILIVIFLALKMPVQATYLEPSDSLGEEDSKKNQTIILIDVLQPLLFGKVGLAAGWRNIKKEYVFYANYVYGKGLIPTTAFKVENDRGGSFDDRKGFDVGVQLKKRSKLLTKPYKDYIKDISKVTNFYSGGWFEISQKSGSEPNYNYYYYYPSSYKIWEFKIGGLVGWSLGSEKSNMLYDINLGVAAGIASGKIFYDTTSVPPGSTIIESEKVSSFILLYKISFQIGFKL